MAVSLAKNISDKEHETIFTYKRQRIKTKVPRVFK